MRRRQILLSGCVFAVTLAAPAALYAANDPSLAAPLPADAVQVVTPPSDPATAGDPAAGSAEQPASEQAAPAGEPAGGNSGSNRLAAGSGAATVVIGDNFFQPTQVSISTGESVTWTNNGQVAHNVTADDGSFSSGTINPGGNYSNRFSNAGSFSYYCTIHGRGQSGTVSVAGGGGKSKGGVDVTVTGPSEAAAVAAPNAAGTDTFLPATGNPTWLVVLIGVSLLAAGLGLRRRAS